MDKELHQWEAAADTETTTTLPNAEVGETYVDGERRWRRVWIVAGAVGGRWAYWKTDVTRAEKQGPNSSYDVIADKIFNHNAYHFAGMLAVPYNGVPAAAWVLVEPRISEGPRVIYTTEREKTADGKRYERSKEVYDVGTGESEMLP